MKIKMGQSSSQIILVVIMLCIGILLGYKLGIEEVPKNCAQLGQLHLKMGKAVLNITDFSSAQWSDLVDKETEITNKCYESMR